MRSNQVTRETVPTITTRGIVTKIYTSDVQGSVLQDIISLFWTVQPVNRFVDVQTTATNLPNPKWLKRIPWNSINAPQQQLLAPNLGDFVVLGFMGGNGDIPYVLSHMPGPDTQALQTGAAADRPAATTAVQGAAFGGGPPSGVLKGTTMIAPNKTGVVAPPASLGALPTPSKVAPLPVAPMKVTPASPAKAAPAKPKPSKPKPIIYESGE